MLNNSVHLHVIRELVLYWLVVHQIRPHDYLSWIPCRVGIGAIEPTKVPDFIRVFSNMNLICDIHYPRYYVHSTTPTVPTIEPGAVLIWNSTVADSISTAHGGSSVLKHSHIWMAIYNKVVWRDTELCAAVIVTSVTGDGGYKFNLRRLWRDCNSARVIFLVVILVEFSTCK